MPPEAMASSVVVTIASVCSEPLWAWARSSSSRVMVGGNFGGPANPPQSGSNCPVSAVSAPSQRVGARDALARRQRGAAPDGPGELVGLAVEVGAPRAPDLVDPPEQLGEAHHPAPTHLREVGAAEEGAAVGHQEHRHRPSALAGHGLHRVHVDGVDVGSFFAVDLDADEPLVHQRGGRGVLERLVGHDVAPVAGGVAHRQQDGPVLGGRLREGLVAPGVPVDRVVGVLAQVRAGLVGESVHGGHRTGAAAAPSMPGHGHPSRRQGRPGHRRVARHRPRHRHHAGHERRQGDALVAQDRRAERGGHLDPRGRGRRGRRVRGERGRSRSGRGVRGRHRRALRIGRRAGQQRGHQPVLRPDPRDRHVAVRQDGGGQLAGSARRGSSRAGGRRWPSEAASCSTSPPSGACRVETRIAVYNGTKAALLHLTRSLAAEMAPGVRVNALGAGPGQDRHGPCPLAAQRGGPRPPHAARAPR